MATTTPAERVARYRADFGSKSYPYEDARAAYTDALHATTENALDAIEQGDPNEARAWLDLAQVISFRYRRTV